NLPTECRHVRLPPIRAVLFLTQRPAQQFRGRARSVTSDGTSPHPPRASPCDIRHMPLFLLRSPRPLVRVVAFHAKPAACAADRAPWPASSASLLFLPIEHRTS